MRISDGITEINVENRPGAFEVSLDASQFDIQSMSLIKLTLSGEQTLLPGKVVHQDDSELVLAYDLPDGARNLSAAAKKASLSDRLRMAMSLQTLSLWQKEDLNLFFAPENIFVVPGEIKVAYRGFIKILVPREVEESEFMDRYKALVLATINPKYDYLTLIKGKAAIRDNFEKSIVEARDIDTITSLLQKRYLEVTAGQKLVKGGRYQFYKWAFIVLAVIGVGLTSGMVYFSAYKEPKQERVIDSQAYFLAKNYDKATSAVKDDNPRLLVKSEQYVLAYSYINLDNLTSKQKTVLTKNISQQSEENELLYWIYSGRGDFKTSLSLARNLGDNQLILYAYTKLYDVTKADDTMGGYKKQKLLSDYKKQIKKYSKKLGGAANGIEK